MALHLAVFAEGGKQRLAQRPSNYTHLLAGVLVPKTFALFRGFVAVPYWSFASKLEYKTFS
jgi:hypothetical protein